MPASDFVSPGHALGFVACPSSRTRRRWLPVSEISAGFVVSVGRGRLETGKRFERSSSPPLPDPSGHRDHWPDERAGCSAPSSSSHRKTNLEAVVARGPPGRSASEHRLLAALLKMAALVVSSTAHHQTQKVGPEMEHIKASGAIGSAPPGRCGGGTAAANQPGLSRWRR
ncbi:hypothetical protein MTO96_002657 [Rhipicephalus appendiculatus]